MEFTSDSRYVRGVPGDQRIRRSRLGLPSGAGGYEAPPQPLRPDSLTWKYFEDWRWDRICRDVLEDNKATRDVLDLAKYPKPWFTQSMPDWLWSPMQRRVVAPFMVWLTVGLYDRRCANCWATPGRSAMNGSVARGSESRYRGTAYGVHTPPSK